MARLFLQLLTEWIGQQKTLNFLFTTKMLLPNRLESRNSGSEVGTCFGGCKEEDCNLSGVPKKAPYPVEWLATFDTASMTMAASHASHREQSQLHPNTRKEQLGCPKDPEIASPHPHRLTR